MKEDTRIDGPWEFGEKPVKRNDAADWEEVKKNAQEGKLDKIPADIYIKHYANLKQIQKDHQKIQPRDEEKKCFWYHGLPGAGKTREATTQFPDAYRKLQNKWWDGYQSHQSVIIDDLGKENAKCLTTHLKLWADPWNNHPGEIKCGQVPLSYDVLIVTSNYHPSDLWEGVDLQAILRRFQVREFILPY